jgi:aspartyl-tRNA(Asn)/glutamyl-tRNA(Gln) amidotransferase subunit A
MNYNMSVQEFLSTEVDYEDFAAYVYKECTKLNIDFNLLRVFEKISKPANKNVSLPQTNRSIKGASLNVSPEELKGLPFSFKDCICTKNMTTSAGAKILENYKPVFDATVVQKLKAAGGAVLGKTQQDSFGFGTFSTNCDFSTPRNPLDPKRSCGGSSGGAAALAKAAKFPHIAIAESTGGSISCPAAFCQVFGLTPTYGLVSRYGLIDYANSLDKIGVLTKNIHDIALGLTLIAGHDPKDSTSLNHDNKDYTKYLNKSDLKGIKIGVPNEYFQNISQEVEKHVRNALEKAEHLGAELIDVSLPNTKHALASYYILASCEASTNLAKYCGLRYGAQRRINKGESFNNYYTEIRTKNFNTETKRRIILGTFARMSGYRNAYYLKALQARTLIINDFRTAFRQCNILAAPTMPIQAPKFSEIEHLSPLEHYQMDILTVPPNLAGIPMLSIPCGPFTGLHLMAPHMNEQKLIEAGHVLEEVIK